jgi:uncharacterized protein
MQLNLCSFRSPSIASKEGDKEHIKGHFALYNTLSEPIWGIYKWEIAAGAFDATVREHGDQYLLAHHDFEQVLGSRENGTAVFVADEQGLFASCLPDPADPQVASLMAKVRRGDIKSGSIGFVIEDSHFRVADGWDIEVIDKIRLYEASVVTVPRFSDTKGLIKLLPAGQPVAQVASLGKALNRALNDMEWITPDDISLLKAHGTHFANNVPAEIKTKLEKFAVKEAPVVTHLQIEQLRASVFDIPIF